MSEPRKYSLTLPDYFKPTLRDLPEYRNWSAMLTRCRNKNTPKFHRWGGRGIKVCKRWEKGENGLSGFECFLNDMGRRPGRLYSLDRWPNRNGNYEPGNVRWATNTQQCNNRSTVRFITYEGETLSMMETALKYGIKYYALRNRISRGWSVREAITAPPGTRFFPMNAANGERLPQSKLTEEKVREIRRRYEKGMMYELAREFGVSAGSICLIVNHKTWKHITEN